MRRETKRRLSESAASGVVALIFLILGFQLAVFVMKVVRRPASDEMVQDVRGPVPDSLPAEGPAVNLPGYTRRSSGKAVHPALKGYPRPAEGRRQAPVRHVESFRFDPNTVSVEDLERLGLSGRQAEVVDNYRKKGGRFRRKEDFARMYVVSDTLFKRLEPFIEIERLELNAADSTDLLDLRGIGPYYASKILRYRERLGGFHDVEQLMEVDGIDVERFSGLCGSVRVDSSLIRKMDLWSETEERLKAHPYLGERFVRALERFKRVCDTSEWTIAGLRRERILTDERVSVYLQGM